MCMEFLPDDISVASFLKQQNRNVENAFQASNSFRGVGRPVLSVIEGRTTLDSSSQNLKEAL